MSATPTTDQGQSNRGAVGAKVPGSNRRAATARPGADSRAAPVGRAAAACFRRRRAPIVALATLLRDEPLSTRKTSFALERGRLTGSAFCTGAGLFSASAISRQPIGREPRHLRPPAHDLLHRHDLRVPLRGRFPGRHRVRLAGHEGVPALPRREPVELLDHVPRPLLGRGQQPGLVELPGPHLAQNSLGKRFLRDVELLLRTRLSDAFDRLLEGVPDNPQATCYIINPPAAPSTAPGAGHRGQS